MQFKWLVLFLFLTFFTSHSFANSSQKPIVGLLGSTEGSYSGEVSYYEQVTELMTALGAKVVLIDYNELTEQEVAKFVKEQKIDRIFFPGDYYNISSEPLPPTKNRQRITSALTEILLVDRQLKFIAICGGLQGLMHAQGVQIIRLDQMLEDEQAIGGHIISRPSPRDAKAALHRIDIDPYSRLAQVVEQYAFKQKDGTVSIYIADNHVEAISNDFDNISKLADLGYRIIAISEDGIIEAVEDRYGNILFQGHPESVAVNAKQKYEGYPRQKQSVLASEAIIKDFLYR